MDFMNRNDKQTQNTNVPGQSAAPAPQQASSKRANFESKGPLGKVIAIILLFSITILLVAVIWGLVVNSDDNGSGATTGVKEQQHVDTGKLQAIFLNGGQVYFGKIQNLNTQYMKVSNIYYLRVNQQVQPDANSGQAAQNDISLVKLGCELHGPTDEMVINHEQVIFWENLKDDGQVSKAVKEYQEQNPNGQQCEQPADSTDGGSQQQVNP